MVEGKEKKEWSQLSNLLAAVINPHSKRKYKPSDLDPYARAKTKMTNKAAWSQLKSYCDTLEKKNGKPKRD